MKKELIVGVVAIFVVIMIVISALGISGFNFFSDNQDYRVSAHFANIGNLRNKAKVTIAGIVVGKVIDIRLDAKAQDALVTMSIQEEVNFIPQDSIAAIVTNGLLGEQHINITFGMAEKFLHNGEVIIDTQAAMLLEDIVGKVFLH
jgi:phospholipid/cholesterol/gamma-HCH transport system substrate-binding protein